MSFASSGLESLTYVNGVLFDFLLLEWWFSSRAILKPTRDVHYDVRMQVNGQGDTGAEMAERHVAQRKSQQVVTEINVVGVCRRYGER